MRRGDLAYLFDLIQSFQGTTLDVLEVPDYLPYAAFIPAICRYLGVSVGRYVLSMHGTLSNVMADHWEPFGGDLVELRSFEDRLFRIVDVRYGISAPYIEDWRSRTGLQAHEVDAAFLIPKAEAKKPSRTEGANAPPKLVYIGRHEKCKGPDAFIDLASRVGRGLVGQCELIGPLVPIAGSDSRELLKSVASRRHIAVTFSSNSREELLNRLSAERMVAVFPSKLDTFNLAALEALLSGCVCAISEACGVIDYLARAYPGIPYLKLGAGAARDSAALADLLTHYDEEHAKLASYLEDHRRIPVGLSIDEVYAQPSVRDETAVAEINEMFAEVMRLLPVDIPFTKAARQVANRVNHAAGSVFAPPETALGAITSPIFNVSEPGGAPRLIASGERRTASRRSARGKPNPLFDEAWYLARYPDVARSRWAALDHYRRYGAKEGRIPNRAFDPRWYVTQYPDVAGSRHEPLDHYLLYGAAEGRRPTPWFDPESYSRAHPEARANPLLHFLQTGSEAPEQFGVTRKSAITEETLKAVFAASTELTRDIAAYRAAREAGPRRRERIGSLILKRLERHVFSGDRVAAFKLAALIEEDRGNEVLCATYLIRAMRLGGRSDPATVERVATLLQRNRYPNEAEAVRLIHGGAAPEEIVRHIDAHAQSWRSVSLVPAAELLDRRRNAAPRVSIIVSIYKGIPKIEHFLAGLHGMPASDRDRTELVLVDSNSPDGTADWIAAELDRRQHLPAWLDTVLVRSAERETIQRAWNRGIEHARGRYFAFMGIDEMNRPDGYGQLAEYLDAHSDIDWVVSDAVLEDVDAGGSFVRDVMRYRRNFLTKDDHLLECCYMSYVGCLYRADIHSRFGFYDDSFRGAGDTEFKNRMLRHLRFGYIDDTIGFFTNYPEERVTQSPLAEIEDLRAWYLHRGLGGLMYRFRDSSEDELVGLFARSLNHRKSYMERTCTDVEVAVNLGRLIERRFPDLYERLRPAIRCAERALDAYRLLDDPEPSRPIPAQVGGDARAFGAIANSIITAGRMLIDAQDALARLGLEVPLDLASDNRWHQHNSMWPSTPAARG